MRGQQPGEKILRRGRCGGAGASRHHEDQRQRRRRHRGRLRGGGPSASALFLLRRLQTFADNKRSTLDAMNYSASVGLTAHLDQVLFPTPGPLHPWQILSNLDQYTMYDPWLALHREGRATVRLQINFLSNQNDPALPELHERLRNRSSSSATTWCERAPSANGRRRSRPAPPGWRHSASSPRRGGATRTACRTSRRSTGGRSLREGGPGIRHQGSALGRASRAGGDAGLLSRLQALGCGVEMAGVRWVTSSDPNQVAGAAFRTIVDHGIQAACTATACTSRR